MEEHLNVGADGLEGSAFVALCQRYGVHYPQGTVIVHEQDPTSELYFVVSGAVRFSVWERNGGRRMLGQAGRGSLFGEVSCFGGLPRSATVTALEDSFILKFDRHSALHLIESSPRFALRIIQTLGDRLRAATMANPPMPAPTVLPPMVRGARPRSLQEALIA